MASKLQKDTTAAPAKKQKNGHMTAATKDNTMGERLWNKYWDKWQRVCDNLVNNHINIIGTTNTITHKYVDNLEAADSGTLGHFLKSNSPCVDKRIATNPLGIRMPDGHIIYSSHTALLTQDTLPIEARHAHIFSDLKNKAFLSISMFWDNECLALFDKKRYTSLTKKQKQISCTEHATINYLYTWSL